MAKTRKKIQELADRMNFEMFVDGSKIRLRAKFEFSDGYRPSTIGVCGDTESVGQPVNSTRRCAVPVDPRDTDTAYRLNHHIIWEQAVVIRLCEAIRTAHCLTLLSTQRLILIS